MITTNEPNHIQNNISNFEVNENYSAQIFKIHKTGLSLDFEESLSEEEEEEEEEAEEDRKLNEFKKSFLVNDHIKKRPATSTLRLINYTIKSYKHLAKCQGWTNVVEHEIQNENEIYFPISLINLNKYLDLEMERIKKGEIQLNNFKLKLSHLLSYHILIGLKDWEKVRFDSTIQNKLGVKKYDKTSAIEGSYSKKTEKSIEYTIKNYTKLALEKKWETKKENLFPINFRNFHNLIDFQLEQIKLKKIKKLTFQKYLKNLTAFHLKIKCFKSWVKIRYHFSVAEKLGVNFKIYQNIILGNDDELGDYGEEASNCQKLEELESNVFYAKFSTLKMKFF
ncbi:hypothetical protein HDU92_004606 [Lobulomyces angularis]|nr:hypothetical protein HDU92_004606 [Lobulomyces angularis]